MGFIKSGSYSKTDFDAAAEDVDLTNEIDISDDDDAAHQKYISELISADNLETSNRHLTENLFLGFPGSFNLLFEDIWLPSAIESKFNDKFCGNLSNYFIRSLACHLFSWAVRSPLVLHKIISELHIPAGNRLDRHHRRLVEVGAGTGYWAALLQKLGADVVAIDNFSDWGQKNAFTFLK